MALARYWHTVRYLRARQMWGRLWFRLYRPRPELGPAPPLRSVEARWQGCARAPALVAENRFRLLNTEREVSAAEDWNRDSWERLWLYNLHYFDDLVADGAERRVHWHRNLIGRWISENPPARGVGWEPYPTSLRIVNWVKWSWRGHALDEPGVHSLAIQARWLDRRLEFHLLGNHLWANAKALVFAGAFFDGFEPDRWLQRGLELIRRELAEQILPDGAHFELSPMYHAIVLEDLLDLAQLAKIAPGLIPAPDAERFRALAGRMLEWLVSMTHPDGEPAFFNDTAIGVAPSLSELTDYAIRLGILPPPDELAALRLLPDSGYARLDAGTASLIADVGRIGPDYLPGHAHADCLSFELSINGRRVLVNAGISTYEMGEERQWQRGTAAHNTVVVDEADSSEVWSGFRVARRARPLEAACAREGNTLLLKAAHTGYRRLPGRVCHRRRWALSAAQLVVSDFLTGHFDHAVARFRLHPDFNLTARSDRDGRIQGPGISVTWRASGPVRVVDETWHPGFNRSLPCQVIELPLTEATSELLLNWE